MINPSNIAIIGCSGAIGGALVREAATAYPDATITGFSQSGDLAELGIECHSIDYSNEATIKRAADLASEQGPVDLVIFAGGILHTGDFGPEKSLFPATSLLPSYVARASADAHGPYVHFAPADPSRLARNQTARLETRRFGHDTSRGLDDVLQVVSSRKFSSVTRSK